MKTWWMGFGFCMATAMVLPSCYNGKEERALENFDYKSFKDSLLTIDKEPEADTINVFDADGFTPGKDSLVTLLRQMDTLWREEAALLLQKDSVSKGLRLAPPYTPEDTMAILTNIKALDSFLANRVPVEESPCQGLDCIVYAEIIKSTQTLYLYIGGEMADSFKVSTGISGYETPSLDLRPSGPLFYKYTSRKFPGGNYRGLGNMPYAVFLRGGYAIHGTTRGNFEKLGTRASHGCIRLHPDDAKIFNALVRRAGLRQTWVTIREVAR